jgi:hypothetical protein
VAHFFPPALSPEARAADFAEILADAARGGLFASVSALVAGIVMAGRAAPPLAAMLVTALLAGDVLRAGAGLNPMSDPSALRASPEVVATLRALPGLQRIFTCHPEGSRAYWQARRQRSRDHEALTLAAWADTLTPNLNRPVGIPSALGEDLTSLVPSDRLLPPGLGCGDVAALLPRLQRAGVSHVLSLDPLPGDLRLVAQVSPRRLAPLSVFVYSVATPVPLRFLAPREGASPPTAASGSVRPVGDDTQEVAFEVETGQSATLVILDGWAPGWSATVDGVPVAVQRAGHHRAVDVPAGRSTVRMSYRPPGLHAGLTLAAASALALVAASWRGRRTPGSAARRAAAAF